MKKILIQFAHPAKSRSRANKALLAAVEDLENVTVNDLYAHYPNFLIDVPREQQLCESHWHPMRRLQIYVVWYGCHLLQSLGFIADWKRIAYSYVPIATDAR